MEYFLVKGKNLLHQLKNKIKSNKTTKYLYDKLQCLIVWGQYQLIQKYYQHKPKHIMKRDVQKEVKRPNVFYFGGDELQDKSGFLQALEEYSNLTYFTKKDGSYGSYSFGVLNREKNIQKNRERLFDLLSSMKTAPDILLMQTWEWRIGLETLNEVRKRYPSIKIVNIAMDDRHSYWVYGSSKRGSAGLIPALDCAFTTSSEAVEWYRAEGCQAYFYPLASDEEIFKPLDIEKIYDVGFVGAKYGIRESIVQRLIDKGIKVQAFGNGWPSGRLPIEDTNLFYNRCRIVLGVSTILGCNHFVSMKLRDFDVPMSGSAYITNYNEDTAKIFTEDQEVIYYKNIDECVEKVESLLHNEKKLEEIRRAALAKARQNTYKIRVKELLKQIGYEV
jgi:DNA-binding NarL/FixJ family response regulator